MQRRPDGAGGWAWKLGDVRLVPYRLAEVLAAVEADDPVFIAEGEKDVDRIRSRGLAATCNAMGALKWRPEFSEYLRGARDVRVVADRDRDGYRHAIAVAESVRAVGATVRVLEARDGKDASDHLDAGHTLDELAEIDPEERLRALTGEDEKDPPPVDGEAALDRIAFMGDRFLALLDRPPVAPVEAARPVAGHLTLLVAPSMTGKTSLALWLAMARAAGVPPWGGVEAGAAGRVLIYSLDEAPEQVARRMRGLATFHPGGLLERYAERFAVIGPDREIEPGVLEALRFDEQGIATLGRWLEQAEREGAPFAELYVDAYADVLPLGVSENDNGAATLIGGALERLAVRFGCAVTLLHHAGKPKQDAPKDQPADVRHLARGASALTAKARVVIALEQVAGMPHLRRVRTLTNLGPAPKPALFQVSAEDARSEELLYWRPAAESISRDPSDYLAPGEVISTTELARRLTGDDALPESREPPGEMRTLAGQLRAAWEAEGRVRVSDGPRNAKNLELVTGSKESE